jgi:alcohol dehydrogenase class IV
MSGSFTYANPPTIRWGAGSLSELASEIDRLGGSRLALVTTRSICSDATVMERLAAMLAPCPPVATVQISQHAPLAQVEQAAAEVGEARADVVVSVGGGSPIDAAKVIARLVADRRSPDAPSLPHVAVPTTLSTAELASGAGVTDAAGNKVGRRDPRMMPDSVIYDGELALRTPLELWLSTGIRALDHAVEGFLAAGEHPLSDVLCLEAVRRLFKVLPAARANPESADVRTDCQIAAWLGYTLPGPTASGLSHTMGKQIGARYGIPHGVTSCLLLPHVMRYRARYQPDRLTVLAGATGVGEGPLAAADDVQSLIAALGVPRHIAAYGLAEPELRAAADALGGEHSAADLLDVYRAAL